MGQPVLLTETRDKILLMTLNRPEKRNAVNSELRTAISRTMTAFRDDDSLRVAIITGAGDSAFCAGADLTELADNRVGQPPRDYFADFGPDDFIEKPVITAVNGFALAGGFRLAQFGDLCIASDRAQFGISEAKWSRGAPWSAPLANMVPRRIMSELLLTAQPISAQRAYNVGLVNEVVPHGELLDYAWALAETLVRNAPLTLAASKWMMRVGSESGVAITGAVAQEFFRHVYASEDALEGPKAFKEGRQPEWKGR